MSKRSSRGGLVPLTEPLPSAVVDNHCHLDMVLGIAVDPAAADSAAVDPAEAPAKQPADRWAAAAEALQRAAAVGVPRLVQVGCDLPGARWAVDAARHFATVVAAVALHPNEAPRLAAAGQLDAALAEIATLAADVEVRAVGETGLDYYRTGPEGRGVQEESFRWHIDLAKRLDKTLVVHDRDSHDDVLRILDAEGPPARVVLHCFSGDADFARRCLERGAWLSFAGTVTFANAGMLREALAVAPLDRVLVETDAPFLTPVPFRGRPNAPSLIPLTLRAMAEVAGVDLGDLCAAVAGNTDAAYGGAWPSVEAAADLSVTPANRDLHHELPRESGDTTPSS